MLLTNKIIDEIKAGRITVLFRRWKRAGVKAGGTQMTQRGVIGIDAIDVVTEDEITELEARPGSLLKTTCLRTSTTGTRTFIEFASISLARTRGSSSAKTTS